jgi:hypothetical protein
MCFSFAVHIERIKLIPNKNLLFVYLIWVKLSDEEICDIAIYNWILTAVKFGRMSKKQREKVEDEVRFHRAQLRAQTETAPDSSVFDTQTPSSSDQLQPNYNGG